MGRTRGPWGQDVGAVVAANVISDGKAHWREEGVPINMTKLWYYIVKCRPAIGTLQISTSPCIPGAPQF